MREIDFASKSVHCKPENVHIDVAATRYVAKSKAGNSEKLKFYNDCFILLQNVVSKIIERSPLKYKITIAISCLVPDSIISTRVAFEKKIKYLAHIRFDIEWITSNTADMCINQFSTLCHKASTDWKDVFQAFDWNEHRQDDFY